MEDITLEIARLNDLHRKAIPFSKTVCTPSVHALSTSERRELLHQVANFNSFAEGNDPYKEHDFGHIDLAGQVYYWKIDCYDLDGEHLSPNPADPTVTRRVLIVMHSNEY